MHDCDQSSDLRGDQEVDDSHHPQHDEACELKGQCTQTQSPSEKHLFLPSQGAKAEGIQNKNIC